MEAARWQMRSDLETETMLAWQTAAWSRAKRLPSLKSVLRRLRRPPRETPKKALPVGGQQPDARAIGRMAEARLKELGRMDLITGGTVAAADTPDDT